MAKRTIIRTIEGRKTPLVVNYDGVYAIPEAILVQDLAELPPKGKKLGAYDDKGRIVYLSKMKPKWAEDPWYKSQIIALEGSKWYPESMTKDTAIKTPSNLLKGLKREFGIKSLFGRGGKPKIIRTFRIGKKKAKASLKRKRGKKPKG